MTLCIAWVRQNTENQELIFATDSCLGGGERWESGVKLFELPRKDCLICFSGCTNRTYPLILSLINSLKFDKHASNHTFDVNNLVDYITSLLTDIIKIVKLPRGLNLEDVLRSEPFDFIFGGWSWKENKFKLWKIYYSFDAHGFIPITDYGNLVFTMIGDDLDEAKGKLEYEIANSGRILFGSLDMEPLKVLVQIIRDPKHDTISGPVQLAKIYPPGIIEFFGVYYPSIVNGKKTFLGRDVSQTNNPAVRFIDPDTGSISELEIPKNIVNIDTSIFGADEPFVISCYSKGKVKENLTEKDKELLQTVLKEHAYKSFLTNLANAGTESNGDDENG